MISKLIQRSNSLKNLIQTCLIRKTDIINGKMDVQILDLNNCILTLDDILGECKSILLIY